VRLDVRRIDHLRFGRPPAISKRAEQLFPHAALRPAHEAIVDRRRRTVFRRAIAPAAAALQHVQDAADHAPVVRALLAPYIRRQMRLDLLPLLVAEPKQIASHDPPASPPAGSRESLSDSRGKTFIGFSP